MSAIISPCGTYRYRLERGPFENVGVLELDDDGVWEFRGKVIAFFGINPSTADASINDQTVMKWIGFCQRWRAQRFIVGNVSAYRATDVNALANALVSPDEYRRNIGHLENIIAAADILVPCWGRRSKAPKHMRNDFDTVMAMLLTSGKPVMAFGLTGSGDPKHPLMLGYDTKLIDLRPARITTEDGK
ncbi:DUF1643 domain-containing protein [Burkholderia gladioli]|uniref:DUF1643 domain-containing protein n=1 Tax=Burkholderia gladioli TaxID=28095 RepID=UPI0016417AC5|nr:DUF1643 domain-containing protein [Burkholderia gladioli]